MLITRSILNQIRTIFEFFKLTSGTYLAWPTHLVHVGKMKNPDLVLLIKQQKYNSYGDWSIVIFALRNKKRSYLYIHSLLVNQAQFKGKNWNIEVYLIEIITCGPYSWAGRWIGPYLKGGLGRPARTHGHRCRNLVGFFMGVKMVWNGNVEFIHLKGSIGAIEIDWISDNIFVWITLKFGCLLFLYDLPRL